MDGDGDLDIVVSPESGDGYWIENELGKEAESLFDHEVFSHVTPTAMGVGDVDGDQVDDVVVGHVSGAKVFFNKGEWSVKNLGIVLHHPRAITVEDMDGDGDNDIVIRDSRELTLIKNDYASLGALNLSWPGLGDHSFLSVVSIVGTAHNKGVLTLDAQRGMLGIVRFDGQDWQPFMPLESARDAQELFEYVRAEDLDGIVLTDENDNELRVGVGEGGELVLDPVEQPGDTEAAVLESGNQNIFAPENLLEGGYETLDGPGLKAPLLDAPDKGAGSPELCLRFALPTEVDYSGSATGVRVDLATGEAQEAPKYWWLPANGDTWEIADSVTDVIGSDHSDTLHGDASDNSLEGGGGRDYLYGRDGDDDLQGNTGDDVLYGGRGDDTLHGGKHSDDLFGEDGRDFLYGDKGNDYLFGGDGDDVLKGGDGTDYLYGDSGDDGLWGGDGSDVLYGGAGADSLFGGRGGDILIGNGGNDLLSGGAGDDWLFAVSGDNLLQGGEGADCLFGSHGHDTFYFESLSEAGDTVYNFTHGQDQLQFGFGSHVLYNVSQPYSGSLGLEGDGFVWEQTGGWHGNLYYDPDLNVAGDETLVAEVDVADDTSLTLDDFSVV